MEVETVVFLLAALFQQQTAASTALNPDINWRPRF